MDIEMGGYDQITLDFHILIVRSKHTLADLQLMRQKALTSFLALLLLYTLRHKLQTFSVVLGVSNNNKVWS